MSKRRLTDRSIKALKPKSGKDYTVPDADVPGFGVRVLPSGHKAFVYVARYPGAKHPTRRTLGEYGVLSLAEARDKASGWRKLVKQGIDPAVEKKKAKRAKQKSDENTFEKFAESYIKRHVAGQRKAKDVEREIRNELILVWGDRPVTSITREDVVDLIEAIADRPAPYHAHNIFGHIRTMFNWAIDTAKYRLDSSPCDRLKPARLIGAKKSRNRVLNDDEIRAFWRASRRLGYPFGPMFQLLTITGQRKSEVSAARWREFHPDLVRLIRQEENRPIAWPKVDNEIKLWTVPPERFKSDTPHIVPLPDAACAVLASLPTFRRGDHLFSTTFGEKPVTGFSKAKSRLDKRMLHTLKAMARLRGDDLEAIELEPFVIHDIRRTVRTRLSSLRVDQHIAEMIIGHGKKGLARVYDQHEAVDEMREGLTAWAGRLRDIAEPAPANVVKLKRANG